jgi:hypothetical protein
MADSTRAPAPKVITPPRPCAVAKPASMPPAPASRPSAPKAPQAPKTPEPMKAVALEPVVVPEEVVEVVVEAPKAPEPVAMVEAAKAPPPPPPPAPPPAILNVAPLPLPVPAIFEVAPEPEPAPAMMVASPSSPRRSLLSIVTWDAFSPPPDPLALAKLTPAVTMRRDRFTKYVKGVVAGCAGLCLIALVRVAVASASETEDPERAVAVHKVHEAKSLVGGSEERAVRTPSFAVKTVTARHH